MGKFAREQYAKDYKEDLHVHLEEVSGTQQLCAQAGCSRNRLADNGNSGGPPSGLMDKSKIAGRKVKKPSKQGCKPAKTDLKANKREAGRAQGNAE
ncbi:cAMP-responsive element-binding protein-like 2, partial [Ophiophagus hannah]